MNTGAGPVAPDVEVDGADGLEGQEAGAPDPAGLVGEQLDRARGALFEGDASGAVDGLESTLLALGGAVAAGWGVLGMAYGALGREADSTAACQRAAQLVSSLPAALTPAEAVDVAPALVAVGDQARAVDLLVGALEARPDDPLVVRLLADQLEAAGAPEAAQAQAQAAWTSGIGRDEALTRLTRAVELAPDDVDYRCALASELLALGQLPEAAEHLARAQALAPENAQVLAISAEAARMEGRLAEAVSLVERALQAGPDHALALGVAGLIERDSYFGTGQTIQLELAADLLERSLVEDPSNVNLRYIRATCLADLDRYSEALGELQLVVERRPDAVDAWRVAASILVRIGDAENAVEVSQAAVHLAPGDAPTLAVHASALRAAGRPDEAVAVYDEAIAVDPENLVYAFERAEALRLAGRYDEALTALDALDRPTDANVVGTRGQVLAALGDTAGAEAAFDLAITADDELAWVWRSKAELLQGQGRLTEALDAIDRGIALAPQDVVLAGLRSTTLLQLDRVDEALAEVERAIELTGGSSPVHFYLQGLALLEAESAEAAVEAFDRALALEHVETIVVEVHAWRGEALRRLDRHDEAIAEFEEALALDAHNVVALIGAGQSRYATEDLNGALAALEAAAAEPAADAEQRGLAQAWAGETLRRLRGRDDEALAHLNAAIELQPNSGFALATRGQVRLNLGDPEGALADLEAGVAANPGLAWARVDLGELLRIEGRFDEARTHLEAAVAEGLATAYAKGTYGQVLVALGDTGPGIEQLREALALDRQLWIVDALANALMAAPVSRDRLVEALEVLAGAEPDPSEPERARIDRAVATTTDPELLTTKAEALRLLGRTAEALACVDAYLLDNPEDVGALCTQAAVLVDRGEAARAFDLADRLLTADPELTFARWVRIRALERLERTSDALADVEVLLEQLPGDAWSATTKASLLSDFQRYDEALDLAEGVLDREVDDPYAHAIAGYCLNRLGRFGDAADHLAAAAAGDPDVLWYGAELGDALSQDGRGDEARAVYERVVARYEEGELSDTGSMRSASWCHLMLDHLDEATSLAQAAASLEPDNLSGRLLLALVLLRAGRSEVAVDEYAGAARAAASRPDPLRAVALLHDARTDLTRLDTTSTSPLECLDDALAVLDRGLAGLTAGRTV